MCGIVGYIGHREAAPVLIKGLEHLEYRGYDSAGIACLNPQTSQLSLVKEKGKLIRLKDQLKKHTISSSMGIGHTRWATHGKPSKENSHPHIEQSQQISLVHNGIIENYAELREELKKKGVKFKSETDSEVAVQLIGNYYNGKNFLEAAKKAVKRIHGFFALVLLSKNDPEKLLVFKRSNPLVIGLGKNENFIASDVSALLSYTKKVLYLEDDEYAVISRVRVQIFDLKTGKEIKRKPTTIDWTVAQAAKGGYPHFMLKEIFEQPDVVEHIVNTRLKDGKVFIDTLKKPSITKRLKQVKNVHFVSCGTAYHAGIVGSYMLGDTTSIPSVREVSSEFRYSDPAVDKDSLVILITQSGETADTLAALREAKSKGAFTLGIVNVVGSTIAREADAVIYTHAGPEIGVASTKAYLAQLLALAFFALFMGEIHPKKKLTPNKVKQMIKSLKALPDQIKETLKQEQRINECAKHLYRKQTFLYLGRGFNYPNALEGALKLKEITYSHAHGYPAGEMKHGPIALIDPNQPAICIATKAHTYDKMVSNIEEIRARKGIIISVATKGDRAVSKMSKYIFYVPETDEFLSPVLAAIPLQLFAYRVATLKKRDVDQPRNLAKSVTVE